MKQKTTKHKKNSNNPTMGTKSKKKNTVINHNNTQQQMEAQVALKNWGGKGKKTIVTPKNRWRPKWL